MSRTLWGWVISKVCEFRVKTCPDTCADFEYSFDVSFTSVKPVTYKGEKSVRRG